MRIRLVDTEAGFDALEGSWNRLAEDTSSSLFATFDYARTAWKHFHRPADRLLILALGDGPSVDGIAPFYVRPDRVRGFPVRRIRFLSTWEGDRPGILARGSGEAAWRDILAFLDTGFRDWEVLELPEQPPEGPCGNGWSFFRRPGWHWESVPGGVDRYIPLSGSWEEYLAGLDAGTRQDWRRRGRRLSSATGGYDVEWVSEPGRMEEALDRFLAVERSGWKAKAGIGVGRDERHRAFYGELLPLLAAKGQVVAGFLAGGGRDLACSINFLRGDMILGRHTAYSPDHAAHAPGILLQAEVIRYAFGKGCREFDLLTMKGDDSHAKSDWAAGRKETVDWTGYRSRGRILPLVAAKRLRRLFGKGAAQAAGGG